MTAHIDQLAEWYESAERITKTNLPGDGDFIIYPHRGGIGYIIERSEGGWTSEIVLPDEDCRILARAPKPKPAWHDAVAVIAHTGEGHVRQVWERDGDGWYGTDGYRVDAEALKDVTPLIEAKVTGEMRDRVCAYYRTEHDVELPRDDVWLNDLLAAALGIEEA